MNCKRLSETVDDWERHGKSDLKKLKYDLQINSGCSSIVADTTSDIIQFSGNVSACMKLTGNLTLTTDALREILRLLHSMHSCAVDANNVSEQLFTSDMLNKISEMIKQKVSCMETMNKFESISAEVDQYMKKYYSGMLSKYTCYMDPNDGSGTAVSASEFAAEWSEKAKEINSRFYAIRNGELVMAYVRGEKLPIHVIRLIQTVIFTLLSSDTPITNVSAHSLVTAVLHGNNLSSLAVLHAEEIASLVNVAHEVISTVPELAIDDAKTPNGYAALFEGTTSKNLEIFNIIRDAVEVYYPMPKIGQVAEILLGTGPALKVALAVAAFPTVSHAPLYAIVRRTIMQNHTVITGYAQNKNYDKILKLRSKFIARDFHKIVNNAMVPKEEKVIGVASLMMGAYFAQLISNPNDSKMLIH
jgi:hypothetical protein